MPSSTLQAPRTHPANPGAFVLQVPVRVGGKHPIKTMHLNGARHARERRIVPCAGAAGYANFVRMCASVRMELA
jgi:hypothetical protein